MDASSTRSLPGSPRSNHHPKSIPEILNFPNAASVALCGNATSTKAVLSALRALQDKIRRLEAERQSAVDQCAQLRSKIQQVETDSQKYLDIEVHRAKELSAEQNSTIKQLTADKAGLELRLSRHEEERKALYRQIEHLRDRAAELELSQRASAAKSVTHQTRATQLHDDLKLAEQREAELAAAVAAEQNEKRRTVDVLQAQLADTEANMEHERKLAVDLAAKLSSAEEMLTNVIGINEYLVRQRSENVRKDAKAAGSSNDVAKTRSHRRRLDAHYMAGTSVSKAKRYGTKAASLASSSSSSSAPSNSSSSSRSYSSSRKSLTRKESRRVKPPKTTKVLLESANENKQ